MSGPECPLQRHPLQSGTLDLSTAKRSTGHTGSRRDRDDIQHLGYAVRSDPARLRAHELVAHRAALGHNTPLQHGRLRARLARHPHPDRLSAPGSTVCRRYDKAHRRPEARLPRPPDCAGRHTVTQPLVGGLQNFTPPCSFNVLGTPRILPTWLNVTGCSGTLPLVPKSTL